MTEEIKTQLASAKTPVYSSTSGQHTGRSESQRPKRRRTPRYKDRRDLPRSRRLAPIERPERQESLGTPDNTVKIIPLGGLGEVGRNMCVLEYKNDLVIIDVGFGFPEEDMPGIDYTLPNVAYLDGKQDRIKGIILTHGHMDHIGGLPYLINRLGNPTIYAMNLTRGLAIKRHQEFPHLPELDINIVKSGEVIRLGEFEIEFFHVNH